MFYLKQKLLNKEPVNVKMEIYTVQVFITRI